MAASTTHDANVVALLEKLKLGSSRTADADEEPSSEVTVALDQLLSLLQEPAGVQEVAAKLLASEGALETLVGCLQRAVPDARERSAVVLWMLAAADERLAQVAATPGLFEALVLLLNEGSPGGREQAAMAFCILVRTDEIEAQVATMTGALAALVGLLQMGSETAVKAIGNLTGTPPSRQVLASVPGSLEALVTMVQRGTSDGQAIAFTVLMNMAQDEPLKPLLAKVPGLLELFAARLQVPALQTQALQGLLLLAESPANVTKLAEATGLVELLAALVLAGPEAVRELATCALVACSYGTAKIADVPGALEHFMARLRGGVLPEQAAGVLWSVAREDAQRERIAAMPDVLDLLVALLKGNPACQEVSSGLLWTFATDTNLHERLRGVDGLVEALAAVILVGSGRSLWHAAGALRALSVDDEFEARLLAVKNVLESLLELIRTGSAGAQAEAAGLLCNLAANDDVEIKIASLPNALEAIPVEPANAEKGHRVEIVEAFTTDDKELDEEATPADIAEGKVGRVLEMMPSGHLKVFIAHQHDERALGAEECLYIAPAHFSAIEVYKLPVLVAALDLKNASSVQRHVADLLDSLTFNSMSKVAAAKGMLDALALIPKCDAARRIREKVNG